MGWWVLGFLVSVYFLISTTIALQDLGSIFNFSSAIFKDQGSFLMYGWRFLKTELRQLFNISVAFLISRSR